jgi:triosephosphate isomerase (TIM)
MRKPFVAGNWKMNKTVEQARELVSELVPGLQGIPQVDRVICPPFLSLLPIGAMLQGTDIGLGAQNLHWEASGAFTGEVSPAMVKEFCQYVIIGHSERRTYFGETDESVNKKVKAALNVGLIPIVCIGETLAEFESGKTGDILTRQVIEGLKGLTPGQGKQLVIAYEPVWAIGTGKAATGNGANDVVGKMIRPAMVNIFGAEVTQGVRVLYGGSVTGENAAEFFGQPEIDGALVGGASLKVPNFLEIVRAAGK